MNVSCSERIALKAIQVNVKGQGFTYLHKCHPLRRRDEEQKIYPLPWKSQLWE